MIKHVFGLSLCILSLSGCMIDGTDSVYHYSDPVPDQSALYPDSYENVGGYEVAPVSENHIVVPDSYHVNAYKAPTSHKDMDRSWVLSQNAQAYTIELAESDKPASVANVLYKAPKKERMAEVKYQQRGQTMYRGLYGSYASQEAAQETLNTLPDELKKRASIKSWQSVQGGLSD